GDAAVLDRVAVGAAVDGLHERVDGRARRDADERIALPLGAGERRRKRRRQPPPGRRGVVAAGRVGGGEGLLGGRPVQSVVVAASGVAAGHEARPVLVRVVLLPRGVVVPVLLVLVVRVLLVLPGIAGVPTARVAPGRRCRRGSRVCHDEPGAARRNGV